MPVPFALTAAAQTAVRTLLLAAALLVPVAGAERATAPDPALVAASLCARRPGAMAPMRALLAAAAVARPASAGAVVPLMPDLAGAAVLPASGNATAQRWFAQGMMLNFGFNHAGAVASFRQAQRLDPACALCWWGEALALGPNINAPMDGRDRVAAQAALTRALALAPTASPLAQALIGALAARYGRDDRTEDADARAARDAAYADAMLAVADRFDDNDDVAVLAAEAVMDTSPWNYWLANGLPVGRSGAAVRLLETVLARNPAHPQAAHLYIHMLEAVDPARAEAAADRLAATGPASAGHLTHMPSHVWHRRGRYRDSITANVAAARADEAWIRATGDRSLLRYGYHPHNVHFIVTSALLAGDLSRVREETRRLHGLVDSGTSARIGWIQAIDAARFQAIAQVAGPGEILALPPPDDRLPLAIAMYHHARAVAFAQRGDSAGFDSALAALAASARHPAAADLVAQGVPLPDLVALAGAVARGRWAMARGAHREAASHFGRAAAIEASLPYMEPSYWHYPVQQSLGAALHLAGDQAGAIAAFRAALVQTPGNGWALFGLARSEAAAGHAEAAAAAEAALRRAWAGDWRWLTMERL